MRTAVAAPAAEPFDELFAFIDQMRTTEAVDLYRVLMERTKPLEYDPCGECAKGACDRCEACLWTERFE